MQNTSQAKKPLGFWILFSLVVGNVIGAGIFLLPASLAKYGSISLISWFVTLTGSLCLAFVFSDLNKMIPRTGGPFLYAREAFGDFLGFAVVYTYWIAWCIAIASMVLAIPGYLSVIFPIIKSNTIYPLLIEILVIWLIAGINLCGIKAAGITQLVTTILKIIPLITIGVIGLSDIHWSNISTNFVPAEFTPTQSLLGAMTITLWAFIGIESGTIPADDATNTSTIGKATITGTIVVGIIYILCTFTLMGLFPAESLAHSTSPFADAAALLFGPSFAKIVAVCAVISIVGAINGAMLIQTLGPVTAARMNIGPKAFTYLNKNNAAYVAFITSGAFITALLSLSLNQSLVAEFHIIVMISTLAFLIPYFICCMAAFILLMKYSNQFKRSSWLRSLFITLLASIYAFGAMLGAGKEIVFYACLFFCSALPFYVAMQMFNKKVALGSADNSLA